MEGLVQQSDAESRSDDTCHFMDISQMASIQLQLEGEV